MAKAELRKKIVLTMPTICENIIQFFSKVIYMRIKCENTRNIEILDTFQKGVYGFSF